MLTLVLSSLRGVPAFVRAQDRHEWTPGWHPALADKTVLLVGYGAIGAAVEARLAPFECSVVRVARSARDGVHAITELPALLPDADVVVLVLPLTDADPRPGRRVVPRLDEGRRAAGQRGPWPGRRHRRPGRRARRSGRMRAAVDVVDPEPLPADSPLWDCPGLLVSPHVGGSSSAMWPRAYRLVRDQLHRIAAGEEPVNIMTGDY